MMTPSWTVGCRVNVWTVVSLYQHKHTVAINFNEKIKHQRPNIDPLIFIDMPFIIKQSIHCLFVINLILRTLKKYNLYLFQISSKQSGCLYMFFLFIILHVKHTSQIKRNCHTIPSPTHLWSWMYSRGRLRRWRNLSAILFLPTPWLPTSSRCSPSRKSFNMSSSTRRCCNHDNMVLLYREEL